MTAGWLQSGATHQTILVPFLLLQIGSREPIELAGSLEMEK